MSKLLLAWERLCWPTHIGGTQFPFIGSVELRQSSQVPVCFCDQSCVGSGSSTRAYFMPSQPAVRMQNMLIFTALIVRCVLGGRRCFWFTEASGRAAR